MSIRNNVQNEPLCPDCGELLELAAECDEPEFDYNFFDYVKPCYGTCPKCGKPFRWLKIFDYKGVTDIKAICPDEDKPSSIATRLTSPLLSRLS